MNLRCRICYRVAEQRATKKRVWAGGEETVECSSKSSHIRDHRRSTGDSEHTHLIASFSFTFTSMGTQFTTFLMSGVATTLAMTSRNDGWTRCTSGHFLGAVSTPRRTCSTFNYWAFP